MPKVSFRSVGIDVDVPVGSSLLDAARRARVRLEAPCNGAGTCGKCRVRLDDEAQLASRVVSGNKLSDEDVRDGWALLCCTLVESDIALDLPGGGERGLRILEDGRRPETPLAPRLRKRYVAERKRTEVFAGETLLGDEPGDTESRLYGAAVDIGSTTLVVSLIDLGTGSRVGAASALNPQATHAQDVLSRINLGAKPEGLALLHGELMAEIDRLIGVLAAEARVPRRRIYEVVLAGNTTMLHLAANIDPEPLGRFPYTPNLTGGEHLPAASIGLSLSKLATAWLPPIISGFVGADITAGILATELGAARGVTLFVDIGTNGEMVLARDGQLQATSTAAGPAFEGMNIACGMRAARGAIERVCIVDGAVTVQTIDDAPAGGLCGSGLLDAVAELAAHGLIESSGRFRKDRDHLPVGIRNAFAVRDGKPVFHLTAEVYLSQGDIRQVQLAKGAVRAGIDVLLKRNGLTPTQVDRALIAGSFGYHLSVRSLIDIGLFPPEFDGKVEYVGNTARTGAEVLLTNASARESLADQVGRIEAVELANDEDFTRIFVKAMSFPARRVAAPESSARCAAEAIA
jgi:uncharacterized 2Fe-2S/4Fe-4S cluster protein (DUF4445 family)